MKTHTFLCISQMVLLLFFLSVPFVFLAQSLSVNNPSYLQGTVTDFNNGNVIANVTVTAVGTATFFTETAANGTYNLMVDEDTYDLYFELIGLQTVIVADTFAAAGVTTTISISTSEMPYPVPWVFVDPNEEDTEIMITWSDPEGPYELIYEDGNAEDFFQWAQTGAGVAVRFTPNGYPATVEGGRIFVGDGSFPAGADFLGEEFSIGVLDDDGTDGLPGTVLDSIAVTVNNYYWVEFEGLDVTFEEGDFYLVMWQLETPPQAAPIGVDTDIPTVYRSYVAQNGFTWSASLYQDFMIRATINGPNSNVMMKPGKPAIKESADDRNVDKYRLIWIDGFDPDAGEGPEDGNWHHRTWRTLNYYNYSQWGSSPPGFYAWGVKVLYDSGDTSVWTYSNIVAHLLDNEVTISIHLSNDSAPGNVDILMVGKNYPYQEFQGVATLLEGDSIAEMQLDSAIDGLYDLYVSSPGFEDYVITDVEILTDSVVAVEMQEMAFPARNLFVDSLTSVAIWDPAMITQLPLEDFEDEEFPPQGWETRNGDRIGWFRSINGSGGHFTIPPGDGFYAVDNDPVYNEDSPQQFLILPPMDLRQSNNYTLYFDHFNLATVESLTTLEYSNNAGVTWEVYRNFNYPVSSWTAIQIDLSPLSGPNGLEDVWFAFNSADGLLGGTGWAIDNVSVIADPASPINYYVYLDDAFVGETSADITTYTFPDLLYGQTYKATVKAQYSSGLSEPIDYYWTSGYLYPPRELGNTYLTNSDQVPLYWLPPMIIDSIREKAHRIHPRFSIENNDTIYGHVPDNLIGFKVYQDEQWIADVDYNGEGVNDTIQFITASLDPACYAYTVSAIYDLTAFGFLGEEGESMLEGPDTVCVVWGNELPFIEEWDEGGFSINGWRLDGDGWVISNETGDPEPSAEFRAEMIIEDSAYCSILTSNPLLADQLFAGDIFLDFNIKLDNINATGEEMMVVEITNDAGKTWHQLTEIRNHNGIGFEDGDHHININNYAMGKTFHLRFKAKGENPSNITSWFIDNINVYRLCAPPKDLKGEYVWNANDWGAEICWNAPELPVGCNNWIFWDNAVYAGGVGTLSGGTHYWAQRWDAGQLKDWWGVDWSDLSIGKVAVFMNDELFNDMIIKIWSGSNAQLLLYEQEVVEDPASGEWVEIVLDEAVDFDVDEELWIGYSIYQIPGGSFPVGYDEGPAISGYGDMISTNGGISWDPLSAFGIDNNILIHASSANELASKPPINNFNVYRQEIGFDDEYLFYDTLNYIEGQIYYCYQDFAPAVSDDQTYNYKVTTNWAVETDTCESVPALSIPMTEDYVTVLVTTVEDSEIAEVKLYPNPATNNLNISSTNPIRQITVFNYVGQVVFNQELDGEKTVALNTASYESGIYVLRIDTGSELINRRVVITK